MLDTVLVANRGEVACRVIRSVKAKTSQALRTDPGSSTSDRKVVPHSPANAGRCPPAALGRFLAAPPAPMSPDPITLADGTAAIGFHCHQATGRSYEDITHHGGRLHHLAR